jgi:hypothetical protein
VLARIPLQISLAHQRRVGSRLIGVEMRNQPTISQRRRVAIDDEHTPPRSRQGDDLTGMPEWVDVAT